MHKQLKLLILSLAACQSISNSPHIDSKIEVHVREFIQKCANSPYAKLCASNLRQINSIAVSENLNSSTLGVCHVNPFYRSIEINRLLINKSSQQLRMVVFHELGHCVLDLEHNKKPNNLMSESLFLITEHELDLQIADLFR